MVKTLLHSVMRLPPQYVPHFQVIPLSKPPPPTRPLKLLQKPRIFRSTRLRKLLSIQQYKDALAKAKEQAKQAADATAKTVSRGALFGALALMLGALAAFFAGKASAVNPTVTGARHFG